jgi:hypothetical protein
LPQKTRLSTAWEGRRIVGQRSNGNDLERGRRRPVRRDMRMKLQALIPAVEHAEEAGLGTKVSWISSRSSERRPDQISHPLCGLAHGSQMARRTRSASEERLRRLTSTAECE